MLLTHSNDATPLLMVPCLAVPYSVYNYCLFVVVGVLNEGGLSPTMQTFCLIFILGFTCDNITVRKIKKIFIFENCSIVYQGLNLTVNNIGLKEQVFILRSKLS